MGALLWLAIVCIGAGFATIALIKGEMRLRWGHVRRKEEPLWFWLHVTLGYVTSLFCVVMLYLAWRKGDDLGASSFEWISGRKPLFAVFLGLIGAVAYKLWGKENSN